MIGRVLALQLVLLIGTTPLGGPLLGSLAGSGRGYRDTFSKRATWLGVSLGPELVLPVVPSWAWVLSGEAIMPLVRPGFVVQTNGRASEAYRSPSIAALVSLGLRSRW